MFIVGTLARNTDLDVAHNFDTYFLTLLLAIRITQIL
jgi:hypothetical protein